MVAGITIAGLVLAGIGVVFITNSKTLGENTSKFYRKLYSKKNTPHMFKMAGALLLIAGASIVLLQL